MKFECPNKDDGMLDIIDEDGGPEDGSMVFQCVCMECGCRFEVTCNITIRSITILSDN